MVHSIAFFLIWCPHSASVLFYDWQYGAWCKWHFCLGLLQTPRRFACSVLHQCYRSVFLCFCFSCSVLHQCYHSFFFLPAIAYSVSRTNVIIRVSFSLLLLLNIAPILSFRVSLFLLLLLSIAHQCHHSVFLCFCFACSVLHQYYHSVFLCFCFACSVLRQCYHSVFLCFCFACSVSRTNVSFRVSLILLCLLSIAPMLSSLFLCFCFACSVMHQCYHSVFLCFCFACSVVHQCYHSVFLCFYYACSVSHQCHHSVFFTPCRASVPANFWRRVACLVKDAEPIGLDLLATGVCVCDFGAMLLIWIR